MKVQLPPCPQNTLNGGFYPVVKAKRYTSGRVSPRHIFVLSIRYLISMNNSIIIPYHYAYFFGSLYLLAIWLFFYWRIPEIRKTLLFFSLSIVWLGLIAEYLWFLKDWWHPITITKTKLGIEDFVASATHLTIPAFLYKYSFSKKVSKLNIFTKDVKDFARRFSALLFPMAALFFFLHYYLGYHIAWGFIICLLLTDFILIFNRPDLFVAALWSGILFDLLFLILYALGNVFSPGVFAALWDKSVLASPKILNVPIQDYIFYFLWGFTGGIIYEYIFNLQIEDSNGPGLKKDLRDLKNFLLCHSLKQ